MTIHIVFDPQTDLFYEWQNADISTLAVGKYHSAHASLAEMLGIEIISHHASDSGVEPYLARGREIVARSQATPK